MKRCASFPNSGSLKPLISLHLFQKGAFEFQAADSGDPFFISVQASVTGGNLWLYTPELNVS